MSYLKISFGTTGWGLFGYASAVLGHLYHANDDKHVPFIDIQNIDYGDKENNNDAWSPFWKPVCHLSKEEIEEICSNSNDKIVLSHDGRPNLGVFGNFRDWKPSVYRELRPVVDKYFRIHDHIQKDVDEFVNNYIAGKKTLALHYRGTDKHVEARRIPESEVLEAIEKIVQKRGYEQVYVCTDEIEVMEYFQKMIPQKCRIPVLKSKSIRTTGAHPLYKVNRDNYSNNKEICKQVFINELTNYRKGYDVIFDVYTMARCTGLVRCISNVSDWVVLVSDTIEESWFLHRLHDPLTPHPGLYVGR
tara:strand:+ start:854 stop:1762 length:909 start_codon:yes stop_codon:yes gene_type:complete